MWYQYSNSNNIETYPEHTKKNDHRPDYYQKHSLCKMHTHDLSRVLMMHQMSPHGTRCGRWEDFAQTDLDYGSVRIFTNF